MKLRLLKFDTVNPEKYFIQRINNEYSLIQKMNRSEFLDWIISLRSNFSDFYTYNLRKLGWEAEEFFVSNYYIEKVAEELYGKRKTLKELGERAKDKIRPLKSRWKLRVMLDYITRYKPDVILVREIVGIPSAFWRTFRDSALLVCRIAAPIPRFWSPLDWDLILTSTKVYQKFFELNGVSSLINPNGFGTRILKELKEGHKSYDVTFVGTLGNKHYANRTKCVEYFAGKVNFKWWGINYNEFSNDSPIDRNWQGLVSGLEMYQIFKESKIVFNDYIEMADSTGVNQRMFEVMGVGSLLLTREAENIKREYPSNIFVTYKDEKDCLDKINYFLKNDKEREEVASAGQKYILENFNYENLMKNLDTILKEHYEQKFAKSKLFF